MEDNTKKKKVILPIVIISATIILGLIIFFVIKLLTAEKGQITLLVAPETAEIEIDGKVYQNGLYTLPAGKHFASISAEGFSTTEFDFELENGESLPLFEALSEETATFSENDYEILSLIADTAPLINKVNLYRRAQTIETILPLTYSDYNVTITNESGNEKCEGVSLCLGVKNLGDLTEDSAVNLIREKGYDPAFYKILYSEAEE
ncbi:hypothetical protein IJG21_03050 [Candidatus Saccharibacteria bacterium]|nr:hypothetical protein [Candidatus Saccharibacteria bacterium]